MKALQVVTNGEPLTKNQLDTPEPGPDEIIVKVNHCGVCHTDLHLHDGYFGLGGEKRLNLKQNLPLTMGHEIQGEVISVGDNVDQFSGGEAVAVYPWIGCGECGLCATEREHLCSSGRALGINVDGGYAEFVRVPAQRYVLPIGDVDPAQAGLLMCSGISTYSALDKVRDGFAAGRVAIIGLGGLGMMAMEIARARFGQLPIVIDIDETKLEAARALGTDAFNLGDPDCAKQIKKAVGSVTAVIDFVGAEATSALAGRITGQAGHIVIVGLFGGMLQTPLPLMALRGTKIEGSYVGTLKDARELLALAGSGKLRPIPTVERPLDDINDVFAEMKAGKIHGRAVIKSL
ncbi:MAG: alcohol dehydrogenase [Woeseiaceae bacterium]